MASYIPQNGDLIILTFDPQSGHEQKGRRPALVVSIQSAYGFGSCLSDLQILSAIFLFMWKFLMVKL